VHLSRREVFGEKLLELVERALDVERQHARSIGVRLRVAGITAVAISCQRESRTPQLLRKTHREHRAAIGFAGDQEDCARVSRLQAVAMRERGFRSGFAWKPLADDSAAVGDDLFLERAMFRRIGYAQSRRNVRDRRRARVERAAVRRAVDSAGEPADDRSAQTPRELALSYFHEYFVDKKGNKILRSYAGPFVLRNFGVTKDKKENKKGVLLAKAPGWWMTAEEDLHDIVQALDDSPHISIFPKKNEKYIRRADTMERKAGELLEWKKSDPRTH